MPRRVLVCNATFINHPVALHTALCILLLVALDTDDFLVTWYETLVSDWLEADFTAETLFMPLLSLVLKLLHSCPKEAATTVTPSSEIVVVAISAIEFVILASKRMINQ